MTSYQLVEETRYGFCREIRDAFDTGAETAAVIDHIDDPSFVGELPAVQLPEAVGMVALPFHPVNAFVFDLAPSGQAVRFDKVSVCAF